MAYREGGNGYIPPNLRERFPEAVWCDEIDGGIDDEKRYEAGLRLISKIKNEGFSLDKTERSRQEGMIILIYLCGDPKMICDGIFERESEMDRVYWFRRN